MIVNFTLPITITRAGEVRADAAVSGEGGSLRTGFDPVPLSRVRRGPTRQSRAEGPVGVTRRFGRPDRRSGAGTETTHSFLWGRWLYPTSNLRQVYIDPHRQSRIIRLTRMYDERATTSPTLK